MRETIPLFLTAIALLPCARADYEPFRITGLVKDVFRDPIDVDYLFLYVEATNGAYYAALNKDRLGRAADLEASIGATNRAEAVAIALRKHMLKI